MIPRANIIAWKKHAPWKDDLHIEQDLILSRALIEIFSEPLLSKELAFRGGTALHKLFVNPPARYSEDIDLVQINAGPIGEVINILRDKLDPWLGKPSYKQKRGRFTLYYRFLPEIESDTQVKLKVEINTREHFSVFNLEKKPFSVESLWFTGKADINCYSLEELIGTKLRALYQRKKGRDLFDLAVILKHYPNIDINKIMTCFEKYVVFVGAKISRAEFEANLDEKLNDAAFTNDIQPLLSTEEMAEFDMEGAALIVKESFLTKLPGEPWKGSDQ